MSELVLVTGAAGGSQGSTGRRVTSLLLERGIPLRVFVHKLGCKVRCRPGTRCGSCARRSLRSGFCSRFSHRDKARLLYLLCIGWAVGSYKDFCYGRARSGDRACRQQFAASGCAQGSEFSQYATWTGRSHLRLGKVGAVHLHAPPYYENVRALIRRSVAEQDTVFLPWGDGSATIPLLGADDVSRTAATLLADSEMPSASAYDLIAATPTVKEIVDTLSSVLQRSIRYVDITDEQWIEAVRSHINPHALDHVSHLWRYFRSTERRSEEARTVTDTIRAVTGSRAQTLEEFFRANAEEFGCVPGDS
jgi:hypothetical protein